MKQKSAHIILLLVVSCASFLCLAQEDEGMLLLEDSDDVRIQFENHFYEALKYKAIGNYTRAITELEKCQQLDAENASVAFEFSKTYFLLTKYNEASLYIERALLSETDNYWLLEQAKKVYLKQYNYTKGIAVQQQIIEQKPSKKEDLVLLYILSNEREKAQRLLDDLEKDGVRSSKLRNYQKALANYRKRNRSITKIETKNISVKELKESFKTKKQFEVLKQLLIMDYANGNQSELLKYSSEGMELFPAQSLVYLMYGRSLNNQEKYSEAMDVLNTGLDFIVEDKFLEADFYDTISISFEGLNQLEKANEYKAKAGQLRKNK